MDSPTHTDEPPMERYRHKLRELIVAAIDFRRIPISPRPTLNCSIQGDLIRVAEHYSDWHLAELAPASMVAFGLWAVIAEEICESFEKEGQDALRPSPWAVRVAFRWWLDMSRIERAWLRLWGRRPPRPGGRPLYDYIRT